MDSTALLFARLGSLSAELATFEGAPAIFANRAPDAFIFDASAKPAVIIAAPVSDDPADVFSARKRAIRQDLRIYTFDDGSSADLDAAAIAIRDAFDNREAELSLLATGFTVVLCTASGPVDAPTSDAAVIGRRVSISLLLGDAP